MKKGRPKSIRNSCRQLKPCLDQDLGHALIRLHGRHERCGARLVHQIHLAARREELPDHSYVALVGRRDQSAHAVAVQGIHPSPRRQQAPHDDGVAAERGGHQGDLASRVRALAVRARSQELFKALHLLKARAGTSDASTYIYV